MSYLKPATGANRVFGLAAVILIHVLAVYALVNGLGRKIVQIISKPVETVIIAETRAPPPAKPNPVPPRVAAPPPFVPPPEIQVPSTLAQNAITATATPEPVAPAPTPVRAPTSANTAAGLADPGACDKPEYPPASLRASESGIVSLAYLIDVDGKIVDSKVERSSGFRRLDAAARKALALCKFRPAMVDGRPEQFWARIEYEWRIE